MRGEISKAVRKNPSGRTPQGRWFKPAPAAKFIGVTSFAVAPFFYQDSFRTVTGLFEILTVQPIWNRDECCNYSIFVDDDKVFQPSSGWKMFEENIPIVNAHNWQGILRGLRSH